MPVYTQQEFWQKANVKEGTNYLFPKFHNASLYIEPQPKTGLGKDGGGFILICEHCGKGVRINNQTRKFCSRKCQYEHQSEIRTKKASDKITGSHLPRKGMIHKRCEFCNEIFISQAKEVYRGHNLYHSTTCKKSMQNRGIKSLWYICNNCQTPFKAIRSTNACYCSNECRDDHAATISPIEFFQVQFQLQNPNDIDTHINNQKILQNIDK